MLVDTDPGRPPLRIDLFVKPVRNEHQPDGPLIWTGESNFPIGFRVGASSLPELIEIAQAHGRQVLPGEDIEFTSTGVVYRFGAGELVTG